MRYIMHDTETDLIGKDNILPDLICSSYNILGGDPDTDCKVVHWSPTKAHVALFEDWLGDEETHLIYHNASFDLGVMTAFEPNLLPLIWKALDEGRIHDTMVREKLLNLTLSGGIKTVEEQGSTRQVTYKLTDLELKYLKIDRTAAKDDPDAARTNYSLVKNKPLDEWPQLFIDYAKEDVINPSVIFLQQETRRNEAIENIGHDPFAREAHTVRLGYSLYLMTAQGCPTDTEKIKEVSEYFLNIYNDDDLVWPLVHSKFIQEVRESEPEVSRYALIARAHELWHEADSFADLSHYAGTGLVIPAKQAEPYKTGQKNHQEGCIGHPGHLEYRKGKKISDCGCPVKMKKAVPEKGSEINLHQYIWDLARDPESPIKAWWSDGAIKRLKKGGLQTQREVPQSVLDAHKVVPSLQFEGDKKAERLALQVNDEWQATYGHLDPVLDVYVERHKIQKIITSYLPCMYWANEYKTACPMILEGQVDKLAGKTPADRIHSSYDALKETGRTSSYASKKGKGAKATVMFPSISSQQVDPRIRQCFIPDEGYVICSHDYSAMELCTAAQTTYDLFGYEGALMKLINNGKDTHSYLGAQIAVKLDPEYTASWGLSEEDPMKSLDILKSFAQNKDACDSHVFRQLFQDLKVGKKVGEHVITMDDCNMAAYYKHFRTLGKPTGLGFWGGLGEATFMKMTKASYGISVTPEMSKLLREVWRTYIPEGQKYLDYVGKNMIDRRFAPRLVETASGGRRPQEWYCYTTRGGLHRSRCSFTAAANGCALQSPGAEGATQMVVDLMRECTIGDLAGDVMPWGFVHDEILTMIKEDENLTANAHAVSRIGEAAMRTATPDVKATFEPALMRRWDKRADTLYDARGNLMVWEPKEA